MVPCVILTQGTASPFYLRRTGGRRRLVPITETGVSMTQPKYRVQKTGAGCNKSRTTRGRAPSDLVRVLSVILALITVSGGTVSFAIRVRSPGGMVQQ